MGEIGRRRPARLRRPGSYKMWKSLVNHGLSKHHNCSSSKEQRWINKSKREPIRITACRTDFVQHGQLALLTQEFPKFFQELPVGLNLTSGAGRKTQPLLRNVHKSMKLAKGTGCLARYRRMKQVRAMGVQRAVDSPRGAVKEQARAGFNDREH